MSFPSSYTQKWNTTGLSIGVRAERNISADIIANDTDLHIIFSLFRDLDIYHIHRDTAYIAVELFISKQRGSSLLKLERPVRIELTFLRWQRST